MIFFKFGCLSWPYYTFPYLLFGFSLFWGIMWRSFLWIGTLVQKIVWSFIFFWWTELPDWIYWCGIHCLDYCCQLWLRFLFRMEYSWSSIVLPDKFRRSLRRRHDCIPGCGAYPAKLLVLSAPMLSLWFINMVGLYGLEHLSNAIYSLCWEHGEIRGMHPMAVFLSQPRKPPDGVISRLMVLFLVVMVYNGMTFCEIHVIWKFSMFNPRNMPTFSVTLKNAIALAHSWFDRRPYQFKGGGLKCFQLSLYHLPL